jgi:hypothetical protein
MNPFLLFNPNYLFDTTPGASFLFFWPLLVFFLAVFIFSFRANKWIHHMRNPKITLKFLGGIPSRMREFAFFGILLTFFRDQNIPWLGMRFLIIALFILAVLYGAWTWMSYNKHFHSKVLASKRKIATDIYLPQPKKKSGKKRR